ncbi:MAG TPA: SEC-C metal-binding domain-containing protein [Nitrososphaeraceae archaeon]|nr:SEC-C metal-binding domain-containing protein [Nitrososphaeraceae archaeon]
MELNRNDPCQCGSGLKYKHCCLKMHQERKRWEGLENNLRESITEYWQEFHENDLYDAINIYGKIIDKNTPETERRLFFDWFIHDYIIPNNNENNTTIIKLFLKEYEKEESKDTIELNTLREWSDSFFRFVEVLEITVGTGYKISDIFTKEEFFLHDVRSSATVKKYDIMYARLYTVGGSITRAASGLIIIQHRYLHHIKKYVISDMERKHYKIDNSDSKQFNLNLEKYLKNESLSLIQYLGLLSNQTTKTVTTVQGDIAVLSKSYLGIKSKRRIISILNSSEHFAYDYFTGYDNDENVQDDTIQYNWIEKLDVTNTSQTNYLTGGNIEKSKNSYDDKLEETRKVELSTLLWLPKTSPSSTGNKKKNNEEYIPHRILGNLSINGKIMTVSCMSDKLLEKCNDILENIAGKYLVHLGDKYTEIHDVTTTKKEELDLDVEQQEPKDNNNNTINDGAEEIEDIIEDDKIPPSVTKQIDDFFEKYYEDWINMKIPSFDNMTPLQVLKTKEGKEKIENLLRDIENEYARSAIGDLPFFPVEKIRKRLGLD